MYKNGMPDRDMTLSIILAVAAICGTIGFFAMSARAVRRKWPTGSAVLAGVFVMMILISALVSHFGDVP